MKHTLFLLFSLAIVQSAQCWQDRITLSTHSSITCENNKNLIRQLHIIGAIKTGEFTLKSGMVSPVYFDMRLLISHPKLLREIAVECANKIKDIKSDILCGVPYAAVPLATLASSLSDIPLIMPRKEAKSHGTKKLIEGDFKPHDNCIIIEDVIVSGESILDLIKILEDHTLQIKNIIVLIDREQGGVQKLENKGYTIHALFTISEILHTLLDDRIITADQCATIKDFCANNRINQ